MRFLGIILLASITASSIFLNSVALGDEQETTKVAGFAVSYNISNGKVLGITPNVESHSLVISINSTDNGILTISLPRDLIDAKTDNVDDNYLVLVDGNEINLMQKDSTSTERTISIPFSAGASEIVVVGTNASPEFGPLAGMIVVVSMASIILVSQRLFFKSKAF